MKRFRYIRKVYDNESSFDFELAKLGMAGWELCAVVRHSPSPARIVYMAWYKKELSKKDLSLDSSPFFEPSTAPKVGDGIPMVEGDPQVSPIQWPDITPDEDPFDDLDWELPDED